MKKEARKVRVFQKIKMLLYLLLGGQIRAINQSTRSPLIIIINVMGIPPKLKSLYQNIVIKYMEARERILSMILTEALMLG